MIDYHSITIFTKSGFSVANIIVSLNTFVNCSVVA